MVKTIEERFPWVANLTKREAKKLVPAMQVAIYVMVGGGFLGSSYAHRPDGEYVDSRVRKRPYSLTKIKTARDVLVAVARRAGLDPLKGLPAMPEMTNMGGIF